MHAHAGLARSRWPPLRARKTGGNGGEGDDDAAADNDVLAIRKAWQMGSQCYAGRPGVFYAKMRVCVRV